MLLFEVLDFFLPPSIVDLTFREQVAGVSRKKKNSGRLLYRRTWSMLAALRSLGCSHAFNTHFVSIVVAIAFSLLMMFVLLV